jgi:hypothetical protein
LAPELMERLLSYCFYFWTFLICVERDIAQGIAVNHEKNDVGESLAMGGAND